MSFSPPYITQGPDSQAGGPLGKQSLLIPTPAPLHLPSHNSVTLFNLDCKLLAAINIQPARLALCIFCPCLISSPPKLSIKCLKLWQTAYPTSAEELKVMYSRNLQLSVQHLKRFNHIPVLNTNLCSTTKPPNNRVSYVLKLNLEHTAYISGQTILQMSLPFQLEN